MWHHRASTPTHAAPTGRALREKSKRKIGNQKAPQNTKPQPTREIIPSRMDECASNTTTREISEKKGVFSYLVHARSGKVSLILSSKMDTACRWSTSTTFLFGAVRTFIYLIMFSHTHIYVYICIYVHTHTHTHTHTRTQTHTHTHAYIRTQREDHGEESQEHDVARNEQRPHSGDMESKKVHEWQQTFLKNFFTLFPVPRITDFVGLLLGGGSTTLPLQLFGGFPKRTIMNFKGRHSVNDKLKEEIPQNPVQLLGSGNTSGTVIITAGHWLFLLSGRTHL